MMYYTLLQQLLKATAIQCPDRIALMYEGQTYHYQEIYAAAVVLAQQLQMHGVKRGDRVLIHMGNSYETAIAFWASLLADAVATLIPWDTPEAKLHVYLQDAEPSVLFIVNLSTKALLTIKRYPFLQQIYRGMNLYDAQEVKPALSKNNELDLAVIIYTSGSTGINKGVMLTHRNMLSAIYSVNAYLQYQTNDKILLALPLSFDYGLYQMLIVFSVGACLVLEKNALLPFQLLKQIEKQQITVLPGVPTLFQLLVTQAQHFSYQYSSLRMITSTGARLYPTLIQDIQQTFPKGQLFSMYGLTECKRCTFLPPEHLTQKPYSVGIAIPNTELWIINEQGQRVGPNIVGQIVIRGATVMRGYWRQPAQTAACLLEGYYPNEKVLLTGDYGYLDEDGFLYLQGRKDDIVKIRGHKVNLCDIELQISQLNCVIAALATTHVLADDQKLILCVIKTKTSSEDQVKQAIKKALPKTQQPDYVFFLTVFPKNSNGKFDRKSLKNVYMGLLPYAQPAAS